MSASTGTTLVVGDHRYTRRDEGWTVTHKAFDYRTPVTFYHDVEMLESLATLTAENARLREDAEALNLLTVPEVVHETMKECDWQDYDAVAGVLHEARKFARIAAIDTALTRASAQTTTEETT